VVVSYFCCDCDLILKCKDFICSLKLVFVNHIIDSRKYFFVVIVALNAYLFVDKN
jgi:hypothetical protein